MPLDVRDLVLGAYPICSGLSPYSPVNAPEGRSRGRTPHRFQPIFDRAKRKELHRAQRLAVMRDYAVNGPHFWDGRHEMWD